MAPKPGDDSQKIRAAGDYVEVIDASSKRYRQVGSVAFFVGDNIYVRFHDVRWWLPTKMFFPEQLRPAAAPQHQRPPAGASMLLLWRSRISLVKTRLQRL
jgi:hypothetical protein